jgi:tetratricopeptide (TPR) repeat protein
MPKFRVAFPLSLLLLLAGCSERPAKKAADFLADGTRLYEKGDYARAILQFRNSIQALPNRPEAHYHLALALIAQGDTANAVRELKKATTLNPSHSDAQLLLARMLVSTRNSQLVMEAQNRIQQLIAATPQDKEAWNTLALADWQLGKKDEAETRFEDALRRFPANLRASVSLAQIKMARRDFEGAEQVLKRAAEEEPNAALPLIALGEFYNLRGHLVDAEQAFRRALALDPKNSLPGLELMTVQMRAGRFEQAKTVYENIAAEHGSRYRAAYAVLLFDAGRQGEAIAAFERVLAENPDDRDARNWLVRAYWRSGRTEDARKVLATALHRNRQDVDALLQRGILDIAAEDYDTAEADAAQVLHFRPDSVQAHYVLARVNAARGALWGQRQELSEALRLNTAFLPARIDLAQTFVRSGDPRLALKVMDETPPEQRQVPAAMIARNWALAASGDIEGLRAGVKSLLASHLSPEVTLQEAVLQLNGRDFAGARLSLRAVLDQTPSDMRALELLTSSYVFENRKAEGMKALREYAAAHRHLARVQQVWGETALDQGDRDSAREAFTAAASADPRFAPATLALAQLDAADNHSDIARSRLLGLLASDKQNIPARLMVGDLDEAAGNHAAALSVYESVLQTEPDNLAALNNAAYLRLEYAKRPDDALKYAQRAQQLSPDNPAIEDTLGWILYAKGQYAAALPHLQHAVATSGTYQRLYHLGMTYSKMGDRDNSRKTLKRALENKPGPADVTRISDALAELDTH